MTNTTWIDILTTDRKLYHLGILLLVGSAFFLSTSGIALRSIEQANGWQILFYRSIALSITVFLFLTYQKRRAVLDEFRGLGWNDVVMAVFFGTGMVAYVFALLYITVANASVYSQFYALCRRNPWLDRVTRAGDGTDLGCNCSIY